MKKSDIIFIIILATISIIAYFSMRYFLNSQNAANGTAVVILKGNPILEIYLTDGSYEIIDSDRVLSIDEDNFTYTVDGYNGDVVIEYKDNKVRVIEEISPRHICRIQGWSSSPLIPITCLPNNVVIVIEAEKDDSSPDDITG